ncbi:hypothetical protein ACIBO2_26135 [Nonomuraea sp. NPDC050022]|uniref:hypothetical protein n=1 Tax=unclassified Nonomuraea TaxID=2593643 RepID=UPI0033F57465
MTSDELKVPSQRADQVDDDARGHDDAPRDGLRTDDDRAHDFRTDDDRVGGFRADAVPDDDARDDGSPKDDFRANDTPTADLSREDSVRDERSQVDAENDENDENDEGNGARHHKPYAPTGGDMLADSEPEYGGGTDDVAGEPMVVESAPAHAAPQSVVLFDQDPAEVQGRWRELQTSFVDDPSDAVQRAEGLVEEVVEAITSGLTARTGELRDRWKGAGDTEQLRLALRDYRVVLERLLTLSGHETGHETSGHETGLATGHETSHATDTAYGTR